MTTTTHTPLSILTGDFQRHSNTSIPWESLVAAGPYSLTDAEFDGCVERYAVIKSFHQKSMDVFRASLRGDLEPAIAQSILGDVPESLGHAYHRQLPDHLWVTPTFFRTDEAEPGSLTEVQCSGSGWDLAQALFRMYEQRADIFGEPSRLPRSLADRVAGDLKTMFGDSPAVHHLSDNASRPHGIRYFINMLRERGIRYLHHDEGLSADDCQFIRSHDFYSLPYHNFFERRVALSEAGKVSFDLPPVALFDSKMILAWPFWSVTREHFNERERALFPFTSVVTPEGVEWEDGQLMSLDAFAGIPQKRRKYFLKYAGTDVGLNWGSRAVFSTHSMSRVSCTEQLASAAADGAAGKPWILQASVLRRESVEVLDESAGDTETIDAYGKWSNFYGPGGHLGQLVMHRNAHKVHGSGDTVMSIVY